MPQASNATTADTRKHSAWTALTTHFWFWSVHKNPGSGSGKTARGSRLTFAHDSLFRDVSESDFQRL
jgi:hypothetical protein